MIRVDKDSLMRILSFFDLPTALQWIKAQDPKPQALFKEASFWQELHALFPQRIGKPVTAINGPTDYYKSKEWDRLIATFGSVKKKI